MEWKIGEIKQVKGEWYQCVESQDGSCKHCDMNFEGKCPIPIKECTESGRSDKSYVIFKKLEKAGEPMKIHNRLVLKVKADAYKCMRCCFYSKGKCELTMQECEHYDCDEENKFIELKQNKEDMEEKKLNLKPFDLQKAKAGKPVCTRDGHKARIICFDYNGETGYYPIVALVHYNKGNKCYERVLKYTYDGMFNIYGDCQHDEDLMMLPEKKEGWVNVYKGGLLDTKSYNTRKEAFDKACPRDYVDTVNISWYE